MRIADCLMSTVQKRVVNFFVVFLTSLLCFGWCCSADRLWELEWMRTRARNRQKITKTSMHRSTSWRTSSTDNIKSTWRQSLRTLVKLSLWFVREFKRLDFKPTGPGFVLDWSGLLCSRASLVRRLLFAPHMAREGKGKGTDKQGKSLHALHD